MGKPHGFITINDDGMGELNVFDDDDIREVSVIDSGTTSASEFEEIVSELEEEHCKDIHVHWRDRQTMEDDVVAQSVLKLDRIQGSQHTALFKGTKGMASAVTLILGDGYKEYDIGAPYNVKVVISPIQMTIDDAPDQMAIEDTPDQMTIDGAQGDDGPLPDTDEPMEEE